MAAIAINFIGRSQLPATPRSPRLRNPDQRRRRERERQDPPLKTVKIGRRSGVGFGRRLTTDPTIERMSLLKASRIGARHC